MIAIVSDNYVDFSTRTEGILQQPYMAGNRRRGRDRVEGARWQNALKDIAAGTFKAPIIRVPVILTPEGPVFSAEDLQQLAQMQSVPETLDATIIQENGVPTSRPIKICHISRDEVDKLEEVPTLQKTIIRATLWFCFRIRRYAIVVRSLKEGVTLSRDGNGNGNGNAGRESKLVDNQGLLADRREPEGL